jgi:hypothetical protein
MGWGLRAAVGLTDQGTQCPNFGGDQQQVAELLNAVGIPAGGIPLHSLPPIEEGHASAELCEAIRTFQSVQQGLAQDARVDVNDQTWQRLVSLAGLSSPPLGGVPLLLVVSSFDVVELPSSASGMPSLTYSLKGPVATWIGPGIRVELSVQGPVKVDWGSTYPIACFMSPDLATMQTAVTSGVARNIGGAALDGLCSKLKLESRAAVGKLFSAISLQVGWNGAPVLAGSIGDGVSFQSIAWDPVERAVLYRTTKQVVQTQPALGGSVQLTGSLTLELKVTVEEQDHEASVVAALVVAVAAGIVLAPAAEWAAVEATAAGLSNGVTQIIARLTTVAL